MSSSPVDFVDTRRYPIDEIGPARAALVERLRNALDAEGCAVLKGFVRPERLAELINECDRVARFL